MEQRAGSAVGAATGPTVPGGPATMLASRRRQVRGAMVTMLPQCFGPEERGRRVGMRHPHQGNQGGALGPLRRYRTPRRDQHAQGERQSPAQ